MLKNNTRRITITGFLLSLLLLGQYRFKEDQNDFIWLDQIGYQVSNPAWIDMEYLANRIKHALTGSYVKGTFDRVCVLTIHNHSSREVYFRAIDSCLVIEEYALYGGKIGETRVQDSVSFEGFESMTRHSPIQLEGYQSYRVPKQASLSLYLPYHYQGVDSMGFLIQYSAYLAKPKRATEVNSVRLLGENSPSGGFRLKQVGRGRRYEYK